MKTVRKLLDQKGYQVWSVGPSALVYEALELMAEKDIGAVVVLEGEKMIGIFSERDYARKVILHGKSSKVIQVKEIMTSKVITIHPDQSMDEAMAVMVGKYIRHLPVVENDKVIGLISISDVLRDIINQQRQTIQFFESLALDE